MLSIERLLVLVEQYIITVEVRMLFSGTTPVKSLIEAFLELTTLNASIKCMRVGVWKSYTLPHPTPLHFSHFLLFV